MKSTLTLISLLYSPTHLHKHCPLDFNHFYHLSSMIYVRATHSSYTVFGWLTSYRCALGQRRFPSLQPCQSCSGSALRNEENLSSPTLLHTQSTITLMYPCPSSTHQETRIPATHFSVQLKKTHFGKCQREESRLQLGTKTLTFS